jgi:hypothetical protein
LIESTVKKHFCLFPSRMKLMIIIQDYSGTMTCAKDYLFNHSALTSSLLCILKYDFVRHDLLAIVTGR